MVTLFGKLSESVKRARIPEKQGVGKIAMNEIDDLGQWPGRRSVIEIYQKTFLLNL